MLKCIAYNSLNCIIFLTENTRPLLYLNFRSLRDQRFTTLNIHIVEKYNYILLRQGTNQSLIHRH